MDLYLLRHGPAVETDFKKYPNDDRPLSREGVQEMSEAAKGIVRIVPPFALILSSPLIRAKATAEIVRNAYTEKIALTFSKDFLPEASTRDAISRLKEEAVPSLLVVGHNPSISELAARLLGLERAVIEFKKGALCRMVIDGEPGRTPGLLKWFVTRKLLAQIR